LLQDLAGAVRGSVVDDDDFFLTLGGAHAPQRFLNRLPFIVSGMMIETSGCRTAAERSSVVGRSSRSSFRFNENHRNRIEIEMAAGSAFSASSGEHSFDFDFDFLGPNLKPWHNDPQTKRPRQDQPHTATSPRPHRSRRPEPVQPPVEASAMAPARKEIRPWAGNIPVDLRTSKYSRYTCPGRRYPCFRAKHGGRGHSRTRPMRTDQVQSRAADRATRAGDTNGSRGGSAPRSAARSTPATPQSSSECGATVPMKHLFSAQCPKAPKRLNVVGSTTR